MTKADLHKQAAKAVEDQLRAEGRIFEANQIRNLRVSFATSRGTIKTLHRDSMKLRDRLAMTEGALIACAGTNNDCVAKMHMARAAVTDGGTDEQG